MLGTDDRHGGFASMPVEVHRSQGRATGVRRVYRLTQLSPLSRPLAVPNNTVDNLLRGLERRVYYTPGEDGVLRTPLQPRPGAFSKLRGFSQLVAAQIVDSTPWSRETFVEGYVGRRREVYARAADSVDRNPLTRRDGRVAFSFTKAEKGKLWAVPRVISPRDPRYNVEVGRYTRPIEHQVYNAVRAAYPLGHEFPVVMKGLNALQRAHVIAGICYAIGDWVAVGVDANRFDQHVSVDALRFEHSVYLSIYKHDPYLATLLQWQLGGECVGRASDGKVKYRIVGTRASGDMNTALGNCLIMSGMLSQYCKDAGLSTYHVINDGDDAVVFIRKSELRKLDTMEDWFRDMGFSIRREAPVTELEKVEFCQSKPVWDGVGYRMVRGHGTAMTKDCLALKPLTGQKVYDRWRATVSDCGLALSTGIPVQSAFYKAMGRGAERQRRIKGEPTLETGMAQLARGLEARERGITPRARFSYYRAFGVLPDEQIALERLYAGITPRFSKPEPQGIVHPQFPGLTL